MKAVARIAMETAVKAAKEKILAMASRREIKLSESWRPTSLISVIAMRSDLSDADKIRLAARAKMGGNLKDLLPEKFSGTSKRLSKQGRTRSAVNFYPISRERFNSVLTDLCKILSN